jgi:hypothetical protein
MHDPSFEACDHAEGFGVEDNGVIFIFADLDGDALEHGHIAFGPEAEESVTNEGTGVHGVPPAEFRIFSDSLLGEFGSCSGKSQRGRMCQKSAEDECSPKYHVDMSIESFV